MTSPAWLSNNDLDAAYAAAYDAGDLVAVQRYAAEIVDRLNDVGSFLWGVAGGEEFPLYNARASFQQSSAQQYVVNSANVLVQQAGAALQTGANAAGGAIWKAVGPVVVLVGVVGLAVFLAGRRGK